jgi:hypothetical protein
MIEMIEAPVSDRTMFHFAPTGTQPDGRVNVHELTCSALRHMSTASIS